ncbi:MAG: SRPBCC family protein [Hyphomicrobiaceae bacterium]|nr:SRPBCC family protein [Hyphomicrobiaceae bacterium]
MRHTDLRSDEESYTGTSPARLLTVAVLAAAGTYAAVRWSQAKEPRRPLDSAPDRTHSKPLRRDMTVVGRTVTINRPRSEVYTFWRDFSNLPKFMENIEKVAPTGPGRTVWNIRAPLGQTIEVESEVVEDKPNELIAWRSVPGSDITTQGRVSFRDAPGGRGTEVEAEIAYSAPLGEIGRLIALIFRREPAIQSRYELKRLKMLMETGEIATSRNQRQ